MKRFAAVFTAALVFAGSASAANLQVEDISIDETLHGGEQIEKEIVLSWSGETDTVAHLTPIIQAEDTDSQGLEVTYSENPVIVPENEQSSVTMFVSADYYIKPDNFTIGTEAVTSVEKETETDVEYRDEETTVVSTVPEGSLNESEEEELERKVEEADQQTGYLEERVSELQERIKALEAENNTESNQSSNETSKVNPGGDGGDQGGLLESFFKFLFGWLS